MKSWQIKVPASTANLGAGFDSLGLALNRYLILDVTEHSKWEVEALSPSLEAFPRDESNWIIQIALETAVAHGKRLPPCHVRVRSDIPLTRGLGSSAAAIVAGIELADTLGNLKLSKKTKLKTAVKYEGHADNVGASIYGGLVITCETDEQLEVLQIQEMPISIVAVSPQEELSTEEARLVLPDQISYKEAVRAGAVSNVLVAGLLKQDWDLVGRMMKKDLYHQPYRLPLIPHYKRVEHVAERYGAFGIALSGAGPTISCFTVTFKTELLFRKLKQAFPEMFIQTLNVDGEGVVSTTCFEPSAL
ncbi:homoserine kinase [Pseudalkalibacillus sp. Hm43]|uniref:homoserine kinase n=1 Tax=Pseudalkalibacillus sp. Hm43 TaxID=3450742 RepID=UPI003F43DF3D